MGVLTAKQVQAYVKADKPGRYSDGDGVYLMIPKRGRPYWMFRYTQHDKRKEMTLGKFKDISLAEARDLALEARRKVKAGNNPIFDRKRKQQVTINTTDDLFEDWYFGLQSRLKHPNIPKRVYIKDIAPSIGQQTLTSIIPTDIRDIIKSIACSGRPSIANDALMYCKQLFNHGIKLNLLTYNPAAAFNVNDAGGVEKSRDRALSIDELENAFSVFRDNPTSFSRDNYLACALLVVLGVRKTELTEAKWVEFNLNQSLWDLPAGRSKSGVPITIPLPPVAIAWLEELSIRACGSDYVFPNRRTSKTPHMGKDTLNRAISKLFGREPGKNKQPPNLMGDLEHFTVHDLRRTCRSLLASAGIPGHVAERCLNHKLKGVEGIYDRHDYFEERREALQKIADMVGEIIGGKINITAREHRNK